MKKILFTLLSLVIGMVAHAQKTSETLSKKVIAPVTVELIKTTQSGRSDFYFVFLDFQNAKYTHIADNVIVAIATPDEMKSFISDLESCLSIMEEGNNTKNITYEQPRYRIELYDFSKSLYLTDPKSQGYCVISKKNVSVLIEHLKTIKFEG